MLAMSIVACGKVASVDDGVAYVSLRINPEIELVVEDGEVIAVEAINDDGEVVLTEVSLEGLSVEDASEKFTETATELGYVDVDGENTVYIDVQGDDAEVVEEIKQKATEKINKFFDNNGIYGKVSPETLEKYADKVTEWGVSTGHAKMIMRILDLYPDMTEDEILELSVSERIALIKDNAKKGKLTAGMRAEIKEAKRAFKENHPELEALEELIDTLEEQIEGAELSEDEKALLQEQLNQAKEELETIKNELKNELDRIEEELEEAIEQEKEALNNKAQEKREKNAEKLKKHREKAERNKEELTQNIKEWREAD